LLALGVGQHDLDAVPSLNITLRSAEHVSAVFKPPGAQSPLAGIGPADVYSRGPRELPLVASGGAEPIGDGVLALAPAGADRPNIVVCQLVPWQLDYRREYNLKRTYRCSSFLVGRLLANLGVAGATPLLENFHAPPAEAPPAKRWSKSFYLDEPEEWDNPYRFFRW
jgi:hypothetical protein